MAKKASDWAKHFRDQKTSGMGVEAYIKHHKLVSSQWYSWRRRILGSKAQPKPKAKFVPVSGHGDETLTNVYLQLGGGIRISFTEEVNLARLAEIVRALRMVSP